MWLGQCRWGTARRSEAYQYRSCFTACLTVTYTIFGYIIHSYDSINEYGCVILPSTFALTPVMAFEENCDDVLYSLGGVCWWKNCRLLNSLITETQDVFGLWCGWMHKQWAEVFLFFFKENAFSVPQTILLKRCLGQSEHIDVGQPLHVWWSERFGCICTGKLHIDMRKHDNLLDCIFLLIH